jgi:soluble lytic murein transglycosylase-like protein
VSGRRVAALAALAALAGFPAASGGRDPAADDVGRAVAEASAASGLPAAWIEDVILAESGGDRFAVSRAGARGLMQLMPATWAELRARLGLGPDPFDVRDNVLAGAAYLRELFDRFGPSGFLAAYNAGPARYAAAAAGRARLPRETVEYVEGLALRPDGRTAPPASGRGARGAARASGLFPRLQDGTP